MTDLACKLCFKKFNEWAPWSQNLNCVQSEKHCKLLTCSYLNMNTFQNSAADFALPFHNDVGPDPSFEEMKKVVCIDNRRPEFLDSWRKSQFALNMWQLMESCWHENPSVRLPSLRIKKNLAKFKPFEVSPSGKETETTQPASMSTFATHFKYNGFSQT